MYFAGGDGHEPVNPAKPHESTKMMMTFREKSSAEEKSTPCLNKEISEFRYILSPPGPLTGLTLPNPDSPELVLPLDKLFAQVAKLSGKHSLSRLEDRILSAFQWAGRATVDTRREEAFLLYMISLESLVLGREKHPEITFQLRLKTAHLLRRDSNDERKTLFKRLGVLYDIRSKIVHSGHFQVTDAELREARQYAKQALAIVMSEKPFCEMSDAKELDNWLEGRLISSSDDAKAEESPAEESPEAEG